MQPIELPNHIGWVGWVKCLLRRHYGENYQLLYRCLATKDLNGARYFAPKTGKMVI